MKLSTGAFTQVAILLFFQLVVPTLPVPHEWQETMRAIGATANALLGIAQHTMGRDGAILPSVKK